MARIDKIYGTKEDYKALKEWCKKNKYELNFYEYDDEHPNKIICIVNTTMEEDLYLFKNCELQFVRDEIIKKYNLESGDRKLQELYWNIHNYYMEDLGIKTYEYEQDKKRIMKKINEVDDIFYGFD